MMGRRGSLGIQALLVIGVISLFLFGLYSYNDVQERLKRSDEKSERLKQQEDSVSAQLQVVYEHKARLEKSLEQETNEHSKTRQNLQQEKQQLENQWSREKASLSDKIDSLTAENKRLSGLHEDLQAEVAKTAEKYRVIEEDKQKTLEQYKQEYMQLKQERDNEVAQSKDRIANLQRRHSNVQNENALSVDQALRFQGRDDAHERGGHNEAGDLMGHRNPNLRHKINAMQPEVPVAEVDESAFQIKKPDDDKAKGYFELKAVNQKHTGEGAAQQDAQRNADQEQQDEPHQVVEPGALHQVVEPGAPHLAGEPVGQHPAGAQEDVQHMQVAPPKVVQKNLNKGGRLGSLQDSAHQVADNVPNVADHVGDSPGLHGDGNQFQVAAPGGHAMNGGRVGGVGGLDDHRAGGGAQNGVLGDHKALGNVGLQNAGLGNHDLNRVHHGGAAVGTHNDGLGGEGHVRRHPGEDVRLGEHGAGRGAEGVQVPQDVHAQGEAAVVQKLEQIAMPHIQHADKPESKDSKRGNNIYDQNDKVNNEKNEEEEEEEGQRDNDKDYEYDKDKDKEPAQKQRDQRGPNVGPVDDTAL